MKAKIEPFSITATSHSLIGVGGIKFNFKVPTLSRATISSQTCISGIV